MIKIIKNGQKEKYWKLEINGQTVDRVRFSSLGELTLFASLTETSPILFEQNIIDLSSFRNEINQDLEIVVDLGQLLEDEKRDLFLHDLIIDDEDSQFSEIHLRIKFSSNNEILLRLYGIGLFFNLAWRNTFSLIEYIKFVQNDIAPGLESEDFVNGLHTQGFHLQLPDLNITLQQGINYAVERFKFAHQKAFQELSKNIKINSLSTRFLNFPDEVRVPCEQYLLYFAEFLRDLGVNAMAEIKHEAGEVLFNITPLNSNQALDNIKNALDVYLQLPKSELILVEDHEFEIAMLKVKANVDHLKSQLSLAKAEIRVKEKEIQALEATLEAKDISIQNLRERFEQQKHLLKGEIAEGIIKVEPNIKEEDKEEFFDGVFALTQFEEKGFRVNLAQLFRKLRDLFNQENQK